MDLLEIQNDITRTLPDDTIIRTLTLKCPFSVSTSFYGVDPGTTHLGLAYLYRDIAFLFEITIKRQSNAVDRILHIQKMLTSCFSLFNSDSKCIIEGASYADRFRQVELSEIRASAVLWCIQYGIQPSIVPPTTIRKKVLGSGKTKPEEVWTNLPPNSANALNCAMYAYSSTITE